MSDASPAPSRISSIDIMRGIVILLMMMDHVRERFFMHTRTGDPMFETIEPALYFTRYLTHFCAPVFIFLAGVSAWLYANPPGRDYRSPSMFLFKRGMVIIGIEVVLYYLVWADSFPNFLFLQVLWAIGACMIGLALASKLPRAAIGAVGFLIAFGHNALGKVTVEPGGAPHVIWSLLMQPARFEPIFGITISPSYPILPWFCVILLGFFAGPIYARTVASDDRRALLIQLGIACLALLFVLRGFNIYGEALPWSVKETTWATIMSFFNFTKYPPSLDYLLITLGIAFLVLAWLETVRAPNRLLGAVQHFGSVPMFIYVVHLYVLLAAYWVLYLIFGATHGERYGIANVSGIWFGAALLILVHYPVARWFASYKHEQKRQRPWLSYF